MISRRRLLQLLGSLGLAGLVAPAYAVTVEPLLGPRVTRYEFTPRRWPAGGLGCSIVPARFGMPPEIVLVRLQGRTKFGPASDARGPDDVSRSV
jgi:hypothetical protein